MARPAKCDVVVVVYRTGNRLRVGDVVRLGAKRHLCRLLRPPYAFRSDDGKCCFGWWATTEWQQDGHTLFGPTPIEPHTLYRVERAQP